MGRAVGLVAAVATGRGVAGFVSGVGLLCFGGLAGAAAEGAGALGAASVMAGRLASWGRVTGGVVANQLANSSTASPCRLQLPRNAAEGSLLAVE
ncbi:hypothetical protein DFR38_109201 [Aquitalea magnusonii]|uniref:Uncharacterized protein n=1 Tax=Aquitalea magnusonii TaxID=332411 RepID=A0A318JAB2_9NEIS|nr:hypothetical protein DFR38_109201 [Aquitalea magnusonii]